jgi:hypothetical protein
MAGVSWAATMIGTAQLKHGAVTTKKLHRAAVTTGKIAQGAKGVALAGLSVRADGTVATSFDRLADDPAPRVFHPSPGRYELVVPGTGSDSPVDPSLPFRVADQAVLPAMGIDPPLVRSEASCTWAE